MPVADVRAFVLRAALPEPLLDARSVITERGVVLVRIRSDSGAEGWGEAACFGGVGPLVAAAVDHLAGSLAGRRVRPRELAAELGRGSAHFGQRGLVVSAISGIELALWDLLGHETGLPVGTLFGADPRPVRLYGTTGFYTGQDAAASRESLRTGLPAAAEGLAGIKIKIGRHGIADDVARVRLAREVLGPDKLLVADANNAYHVAEAVAFAEQVRDARLLFLEEPIPFGLPRASAELRGRCGVAVSGYELEPTYEGCLPYIEQRAVDYIQPDTTWSGGLVECLAVAEHARRNGVRFIPHNFSGVIGTAANYHASSLSGGSLLEVDRTGNPLADLGLLRENGWSLSDGSLLAPDRPGLGVRLSQEWIEEYEVQR